MAQVVKAHRERPLALAAFLHGVAVHELTHLDGLMWEGHTEEFVSRREDLGAATAHLLPAIAVLATKLLRRWCGGCCVLRSWEPAFQRMRAEHRVLRALLTAAEDCDYLARGRRLARHLGVIEDHADCEDDVR
jgi:hypothetical protein